MRRLQATPTLGTSGVGCLSVGWVVRRWGGVGWRWHADALLRIDEGAQPVDLGLLLLVRLPLLRELVPGLVELVPGLVELAALGLSLARHVLVHEPQVGELSELRSPRSELSSLPRDLSSPPHDLSSLSGEQSSHDREPPRRMLANILTPRVKNHELG